MMTGLMALAATVAGVAFFFAIIGVFGLGGAIGALALFVMTAVGIAFATRGRQA